MTQKHVSSLDFCFQTCESSTQKLSLAAQIQLIALSVVFLIYSDACSHCSTETRGLLYPRQKRLKVLERFGHCLACHGWLDYCLRLDELSANMYISACCSRSSRLLGFHVTAESLTQSKLMKRQPLTCSGNWYTELSTQYSFFFILNFRMWHKFDIVKFSHWTSAKHCWILKIVTAETKEMCLI